MPTNTMFEESESRDLLAENRDDVVVATVLRMDAGLRRLVRFFTPAGWTRTARLRASGWSQPPVRCASGPRA